MPLVVEPDVDVPDDVRAAGRVFATPLRVAMLHALAEVALTTAELVEELDLTTRGTLPANLRALEDARAISGTPAAGQRQGRTVRWRTDPERVRELACAVTTFSTGPTTTATTPVTTTP